MSSSNEKTQDQEQLKLLSIFHYVVGVLAALFSCFFIIHLVIGIIAIVSPGLTLRLIFLKAGRPS